MKPLTAYPSYLVFDGLVPLDVVGYYWECNSSASEESCSGMMSMVPVVYFVLSPDTTPRMVKIGNTFNMRRRMEELKVRVPGRLLLMCLVPYGNMRHAQQGERHFHKHFNASRSHGEWFRWSEEIIEFIKEYRYA